MLANSLFTILWLTLRKNYLYASEVSPKRNCKTWIRFVSICNFLPSVEDWILSSLTIIILHSLSIPLIFAKQCIEFEKLDKTLGTKFISTQFEKFNFFLPSCSGCEKHGWKITYFLHKSSSSSFSCSLLFINVSSRLL